APRADAHIPSRLHHHLALTRAGRGDGEGGRDNPPVEPELSPAAQPTHSADDPEVLAASSRLGRSRCGPTTPKRAPTSLAASVEPTEVDTSVTTTRRQPPLGLDYRGIRRNALAPERPRRPSMPANQVTQTVARPKYVYPTYGVHNPPKYSPCQSPDC